MQPPTQPQQQERLSSGDIGHLMAILRSNLNDIEGRRHSQTDKTKKAQQHIAATASVSKHQTETRHEEGGDRDPHPQHPAATLSSYSVDRVYEAAHQTLQQYHEECKASHNDRHIPLYRSATHKTKAASLERPKTAPVARTAQQQPSRPHHYNERNSTPKEGPTAGSDEAVADLAMQGRHQPLHTTSIPSRPSTATAARCATVDPHFQKAHHPQQQQQRGGLHSAPLHRGTTSSSSAARRPRPLSAKTTILGSSSTFLSKQAEQTVRLCLLAQERHDEPYVSSSHHRAGGTGAGGEGIVEEDDEDAALGIVDDHGESRGVSPNRHHRGGEGNDFLTAFDDIANQWRNKKDTYYASGAWRRPRTVQSAPAVRAGGGAREAAAENSSHKRERTLGTASITVERQADLGTAITMSPHHNNGTQGSDGGADRNGATPLVRNSPGAVAQPYAFPSTVSVASSPAPPGPAGSFQSATQRRPYFFGSFEHRNVNSFLSAQKQSQFGQYGEKIPYFMQKMANEQKAAWVEVPTLPSTTEFQVMLQRQMAEDEEEGRYRNGSSGVGDQEEHAAKQLRSAAWRRHRPLHATTTAHMVDNAFERRPLRATVGKKSW